MCIPEESYHYARAFTHDDCVAGMWLPHRTQNVPYTTVSSDMCEAFADTLLAPLKVGKRRRAARLMTSIISSWCAMDVVDARASKGPRLRSSHSWWPRHAKQQLERRWPTFEGIMAADFHKVPILSMKYHAMTWTASGAV